MKVNFDSPADEAQIQIIPLIDVIFCILTFFILAALQLTRQQGINMELPRAETSSVLMREMLVVVIDANGQTYVENQGKPQPVDRVQLFQLLQIYAKEKPEGLLVLQAAKTAFYNDVIQVLDIMRTVGGDRVALATDPNSQQPQNSTAPGQSQPSPAPFQTTPAPGILNPSPGLPTDSGVPTNPTNPAPGQTTAPTNPVPQSTTPTQGTSPAPQQPQ